MAMRLCYQADVKLAAFQSYHEVPHSSTHTDELWYNETVCLWMTTYILYVQDLNNAFNSLLKFKMNRIFLKRNKIFQNS